KSNVIDAVRWVMGESSARNLRGESLTDVIFNGSASRKPVAQASVELIFDNTSNKLQGEYVKYNEVSVKRVLNRDGQSNFFLNKTRCRRKDITDLFLGTGLGPRSYSIIEQGMISRLIEAKPEDVRIYIEEAAGISKYKERRRETENRIKHSRENIERLDDIRHELETQLNRLQRQSRTAKRYQELKRIERLKKAQLHALRWRKIEAKASEKHILINLQETELEKHQFEADKLVNQINASRENLSFSQETFNKIQGQYYQLESSISRLETSISHQIEKDAQQLQDLKHAENAYQQTTLHVQKSEQQLAFLLHQIDNLKPQFELASEALKSCEENLKEAEQKQGQWQKQWDELMLTMQEPSQIAQVERTTLNHIEQSIIQFNQRHQKLNKELDELILDETKDLVKELSDELELLSQQISLQQEILDETKNQNEQSQDLYQQSNKHLHELRHQQQKLVGKQSSLEHLQKAALHKDSLYKEGDKSSNWFIETGLLEQKQLIESIRVEQDYEHLVEYVLSEYLQAYTLNQEDYRQTLEKLPTTSDKKLSCCLLNRSFAITTDEVSHFKGLTSLASVVSGDVNKLGFLEHCYVTENLTQARALQTDLLSHQSILTKDGYVLGQNWVKTQQANQQQHGMIDREKQLKSITIEIGELIQNITEKEEILIEQKKIQQTLNEKENELATVIREQQKNYNQKNNILHSKQLFIEQTQQRVSRIKNELDEIVQQRRTAQEKEKISTQKLHDALEKLELQSKEKDSLSLQKDLLRFRVEETRQQNKIVQDEKHQHEIKFNRLQSDYRAMQKDV
ncbi:MAG: hypothetical protein HQL46_16120, partial [Gammaproteobacteria bacterium]|nr:hypothetical protein [Gammaproteobacteria bacterium]